MALESFDELPLHDAPVSRIVVDLENRECRIELHAFVSPGVDAVAYDLVFDEVRQVDVPSEHPWGHIEPSINRQWLDDDSVFRIELVSGDVVVLIARSFRFVRSESPTGEDRQTKGS